MELDIRVVMLLLGLGLASTQAPQMLSNMGRYNSGIEAARERQENTKALSAMELALKQEAEIANRRYREGCTMVNTLETETVAAAIKDGEPIVDGAYRAVHNPNKPNPGHYLGANVTACDAHGKTTVTKFDPTKGYAVAAWIASTRDQTVIGMAIERARKQRNGRFKVPGFSNDVTNKQGVQ